MKTKQAVAGFLLTSFLILFAFTLVAAEPLLDPSKDVAVQVPDAISKIVIEQAAKHPWIIGLLAVLGIAGRVVQPTLDFAHRVVKETATPADDEFVAKVENSTALKWVIKFFSYAAGINPIHPDKR